jgi:hypothetical protein
VSKIGAAIKFPFEEAIFTFQPRVQKGNSVKRLYRAGVSNKRSLSVLPLQALLVQDYPALVGYLLG